MLSDKEESEYVLARRFVIIIIAFMSFLSPYLSMILTDYFNDDVAFSRVTLFNISIGSAMIIWCIIFLVALGVDLESKKEHQEKKRC